MTSDTATEKFLALVQQGELTVQELAEAEAASVARGVELERVLLAEYRVPRDAMLHSLSLYYGCPSVEYDERMPVPPELFSGLDGERLSLSQWFPIATDGQTVVIAAHDPGDPIVLQEAGRYIRAGRFEVRVALGEDIQWFIQDFLHAKVGHLIGTERTGLAYWRNTMAHWRTRLACYRNDLAKARTDLAFLRWGLGLIALADALIRLHRSGSAVFLYWIMIGGGVSFLVPGLYSYLKIRKSRMRPPENQTLVEVTSVTLHFLENYHFIDDSGAEIRTKGTMLARLGDFLALHSTILYPSPASRERTHLARERNVLAGQRTVAACYRTLYARARTGLAFIRSGVSFLGVGIGLMQYFGVSVMSLFDSLLILAGIFMTVDGALWYMPVRREQAETPRCPVPNNVIG
jgi:uncharacterized membrane protein YidH (DUF202 family)